MLRLALAAALAAGLAAAPAAAEAAPRCRTPAGKLVKCPARPVVKATPTASAAPLCKARNKAGACVARSRETNVTGRAKLGW